MIDVTPHQLKIIIKTLREYVPECEVRAFGSRVSHTAKSYSDLDLAVVGKAELNQSRLNRLIEAFEESELPFRIDVLDWNAISESFRIIIEQSYEIIQSDEIVDF